VHARGATKPTWRHSELSWIALSVPLLYCGWESRTGRQNKGQGWAGVKGCLLEEDA